MTNQDASHDPAKESTTTVPDVPDVPEDEWSVLPAAIAPGVRALSRWAEEELGPWLRETRAARDAGRMDAIGDPGETLASFARRLDALASALCVTEAPAATLGDLAGAYWARIAEQRDAAPTGLAGLDRALGGGLQPRRLVALLGAPGKGKTTLANQIAEHVANGGRPVVYATMEDHPSALLAKTMARIAQLDYGAVLQGRAALRPALDAALAQVMARRSAARLLYVDVTAGRLSLPALEARAAAHFAAYGAEQGGGPGLLVVDYLQRAARELLSTGAQTELRLQVSALTDQLRGVAQHLDCTVLALASQNRAGYGGASALASGKESGDIEYGVDVLAAIGEDGETKRTPPIHCRPYVLRIDKNRQGETCALALDWQPTRQQFTEAAK